jgi:hypothetical protein
MLVLLALFSTSQLVAARAEAANAADAAALAAAPVTFRPFGAAGGPVEEAARFAAANGAVLLRCRCQMDTGFSRREVEVEVEIRVPLLFFGTRRVSAIGRAEFVPARLLAPEHS